MSTPKWSVRPTVAVVAVHGVADQTANASARTIAGLLLQAGKRRRYTSAHEIALRIPTARAEVPSADPPTGSRYKRSTVFEDEASEPKDELGNKGRLAPLAAPDHQLMCRQLRWYSGSDEPYETVRLETQRLDSTGSPAIDVHVYEMFWADLSRLAEGTLRFFSELYQLLFHTANLGRQALQHAALEHVDSGNWPSLCGDQKWSVRILTVFLPVLALVIVAIGSTPLALLVPAGWQAPVAVAFAGGGLALALAYREYRMGKGSGLASWTVIWFVGMLVAAGLLRMVLGRGTRLHLLLILEGLAVATLLLIFVLKAFDRNRPGALWLGRRLHAIASVAFLLLLSVRLPAHLETASLGPIVVRSTRATLWTVEVLYLVGMAAWAILFVFGVCAWVRGALVVHQARKGAVEPEAMADRAARAVRTSRLTLALPAAAFLIVTSMLWFVVLRATITMLERSSLPEILKLEHCPLMAPCTSVRDFLQKLLDGITGLGVPIAGLLMAIALGLLGWWLVPIVVAEVRHREDGDEDDDGDLSERMGTWLSAGWAYALTWIGQFSGFAFVFGFGLMIISFLISWFEVSGLEFLMPVMRLAKAVVEFTGGLLVAGAVSVLALPKGRLKTLSGAVRPALDVILDVDGYLREDPPDNTPRACIVERYVSLLRYLCAWRNPLSPNRPYQAIILVAHSQGTVITTDLLGFLQRERDPALDSITRGPSFPGAGPTIPIYLFTMGCPLRQLYEEFFPHLYSWVKRRPAAWEHVDLVRPNGAVRAAPSPSEFATNPDPAGMRITEWTNAYRSGDYVGRYLWLSDEDSGRFRPGRRCDVMSRRWEICIGAGAHTHYWDSITIARELDKLIVKGRRRRARSPNPGS